jgi:ubiquinone/menaquinone biosynthesis C-methylase UbiE
VTATARNPQKQIIHWVDGIECCDAEWERGYADFETPDQEVAKFQKRYRSFGVDLWPKDLRIAELFCGRGNGLVALAEFGFPNLTGVDLAPNLLRQYSGEAQLFVGDCRKLEFDDHSIDVVAVQGGLHHLPDLDTDLATVFDEVARVLVPEGRFLIVEPWLTAFLRTVHFLSRQTLVRRLSARVDALQRMIEREQETYDAWLSRPEQIKSLLTSRFETESLAISFGKIQFSGRTRVVSSNENSE